MGALDGRVAIITGAGRGIGREHALLFAQEGAKVVVNDVGAQADGTGDDRGTAAEVAAEIKGLGGEALANVDDVADWEGARRLIHAAIATFGGLHVLVNNAGILRDRMIVNMSAEEWDTVIEVHLKGHFVPLHHAAVYWRQQTKMGKKVDASVINTSSTSGLVGNPGQANYGTAKAGIAALTVIAAQELSQYGVRVNAIVPSARTRLTESSPGLDAMVQPPKEAGRFDDWDPANVSPVAGWLATAGCQVSGRVLFVFGGTVQPMTGWTKERGMSKDGRWSIAELQASAPQLLG